MCVCLFYVAMVVFNSYACAACPDFFGIASTSAAFFMRGNYFAALWAGSAVAL
jgi:hypothetical protein